MGEDDEIFKLTSKDGNISVEKETVPVAEPKNFVPDMIFEQEPSQLLNSILPLYLNGQLLPLSLPLIFFVCMEPPYESQGVHVHVRDFSFISGGRRFIFYFCPNDGA